MTPATASDLRPLRIERIGAEGDGVGRLDDGSLCYVAGTLPGEHAMVRVGGRRGDGRSGVAESLAERSPDRVQPPCRHFGACGGCALQHWRAEPYGAWKSGLLDAALRRAGYAPALAPLHPATPGARRRMDLAIRRAGPSIELGLHPARDRAVVDMQECAVLRPELAALLPPLRELLRGLSLLRRDGSAIANLLDSGPDLLLRADAPASATDRARLAAFAAAHGIPRISIARGAGEPEVACLLRPPVTALSGVAVSPPPGGFLQATADGEAAIVAAVVAGLPGRLPARARVAELYAGCGSISFALAARARVEAYEGDAAACAALKAACNAAGLAGRIEVRPRDLARQPLSAKELAGFAAVVLDPPHAGAAEQIGAIAASKVPRVIYVSCNPASLGRDAAALRAAGYELLSADPIDQFLWSARLESVSVFARRP